MNIKRTVYFIIFYFLVIFPLFPQSFKAINKQANQYFLAGVYDKALSSFLILDSLAPGSGELNYRIGICFLKSPQKSKALYYLLKAKGFSYNSQGIDFNLGLAYHSNEKFKEAIECFEKLKRDNQGHIDSRKLKEINHYIFYCQNGIGLVSKPINVTITNLGKNINTLYPEYAPVISGNEDKLIFTSKRPGTNKTLLNEDIFISEKDSSNNWKAAVPIQGNINTHGHDASVALTADGQKLLIYKDSGNGDIYLSELKGNNWMKPVPLPAYINSRSWEPSASISPDGKLLLLVSNRPGGIGGMDIYGSTLKENGAWAPLVNLGPSINTEYDEDAPFFHPDGKTIYFSSQGHNSMGGFDIFSFLYTKDSMPSTLPENIGYPINTVNDELFFVWSPDGKRGYFASDRPDGYGDKDIYIVNRPVGEASLIIFRGNTFSDKNPIEAKISVTDNRIKEVMGVYHSNSSTGKFSTFIVPGRNYSITVEAEGYMPYFENINLVEPRFYEIVRQIYLKPVVSGNSIVLNNVFYDSGKSQLKNESFAELEKVAQFLHVNNSIKVLIAGYTDNIGDSVSNKTLSEDRAKEVVKYLEKKGIAANRLKAEGYGEKNPIATNETETGRKSNRRTELLIINK